MISVILGWILVNMLMTIVFAIEEDASISEPKDLIVLFVCSIIPICTILLIYKYIKEQLYAKIFCYVRYTWFL